MFIILTAMKTDLFGEIIRLEVSGLTFVGHIERGAYHRQTVRSASNETGSVTRYADLHHETAN